MQEVNEKVLEKLIEGGKKAGKDVSKLEASLLEMKKKTTHELAVTDEVAAKPEWRVVKGQKKKVRKTERGTVVIESTGPANEDDFK